VELFSLSITVINWTKINGQERYPMWSLTFSLLFACLAVSATAQTNQKILFHIGMPQVEPQIEAAFDTNLSSTSDVPGGLSISGFREGADVTDGLRALGGQNVVFQNLLTDDGQEAIFTAGGSSPTWNQQHREVGAFPSNFMSTASAFSSFRS
jgi:hypothetical protein